MTEAANTQPELSPEAKARMKSLSEELRCLVCQNQTLADSHAELAVDLRREVEKMVAAGRSNDQIKTYLVERYGDFVLYNPPVQANTIALWFAPFVLLLIGAIVWAAVQRRSRMRAAGAGASPGASPGATAPGSTSPAANATAQTVVRSDTAGQEPADAPRTSPSDRERARKLLGLDEES